MTDPITVGYVANLGSGLTLGVLGMLPSHLKESLAGDSQQQALVRCYQAATATLLPEDEPARQEYHSILSDFFSRAAVQAEMAQLIRGSVPDQEILVEYFKEASYYVADLPPYDFPTRLAAAFQAFLYRAEQESELVDIIKVAQLRDIVAILQKGLLEGIGPDVKAIRRVVERSDQSTIEVPANAPILVERAVRQLDSRNKQERLSAIDALRQSNHPSAQVVLEAALQADMQDVRIYSAIALATLGLHQNNMALHYQIASNLIEGVRSGKDWDDQWQAIQVLGRVGGREAVAVLGERILDEDQIIRKFAVDALGELGEITAVPVLLNAFEPFSEMYGYSVVFYEAVRDALISIVQQQNSDEALNDIARHR